MMEILVWEIVLPWLTIGCQVGQAKTPYTKASDNGYPPRTKVPKRRLHCSFADSDGATSRIDRAVAQAPPLQSSLSIIIVTYKN